MYVWFFNYAKRLKYVKIYGLPRSGTNYVAKLLEINFKTRVLLHVGQGKHNIPRILTHDDIRKVNKFDREGLRGEEEIDQIIRYMKKTPIYYVMILKNPLSWLMSYRKYLQNHPVPGIPHVFHIDRSVDELIGAVNWWNDTAKHFINLQQSNPEIVQIVIYENLLNDYQKVLRQTEKQFSLKRTHHGFVNFNKTMLPGFHSSNEDFQAIKGIKHSNIGLTTEQYALLVENLDSGVMQYLNLSLPGYDQVIRNYN